MSKKITLESLQLTPEEMNILVRGSQKFLPPDPETETISAKTDAEVDPASEE